MYFLALKDWLLTGIIRPSKKDLRFSLVSQVFIAVYEITYLLLSNVYIVDMVFNDVDPWKIWISTKTIFYMFSSSAVFILLIFLYKYLFKCKVWLGPMVIQTLFFFIAVNGWHKVWSNVEISHFAPRTDVLPIVVSIIVSIIWPIVYQKWGD